VGLSPLVQQHREKRVERALKERSFGGLSRIETTVFAGPFAGHQKRFEKPLKTETKQYLSNDTLACTPPHFRGTPVL
jgi:hypothetical protein